MEHPKWFKSDADVKKGHVVLFLKHESDISSSYQFGMVCSVEFGRDEKIRRVTLKYRNHKESVDRETKRSVRDLVVIHKVDEFNLMEQLYKATIST